jgi:RHS repeat-associated protein
LTALVHLGSGGGAIGSYSWSYDLNSWVTSETFNGQTTSYAYDDAGQLTSATGFSYGYDANGNPTGAGEQIGGNNQLQSDGTWGYTYDDEGNRIQKTNLATGEYITYAYDNLNHLTQVQDYSADGTLQSEVDDQYAVDGSLIGESVWTASSGQTTVTHFLVGPDGNVWADLDGSNQVQTWRMYLDGQDQVVARVDADGTVDWYLTDRQGSVRQIVDDYPANEPGTGNLVGVENYTPFGQVQNSWGLGLTDPYGFQGTRFEAVTGLEYHRARWYDPSTQQWISQDPEGFGAGQSNLSQFVGNDPVNATDPTGNDLFALGKQNAEYARQVLLENYGIETTAFELPGNGTGNSPGQYAGPLPAGASRDHLWVISPEGRLGRMPNNLGEDTYATKLYWGLADSKKRTLSYFYNKNHGDASEAAETWVTTQEINADKDLSWRDRIAVYVENTAYENVAGFHGGADQGGVVPTHGDLVKLAEAATAGTANGAFNLGQVIGPIGLGLQLTSKPFVPPVAPPVAPGTPKGGPGGILGRAGVSALIGYSIGEGIKADFKVKLELGKRILDKLIETRTATREALKQLLRKKVDVDTRRKEQPKKACFVAGTPLLTPGGSRLIETFQAGELIFTRSESHPEAPVETRIVEEVFLTQARVLNLHVGDQVIGTTAEHPFFVYNKGWIGAGDLRPGDQLVSHNGQLVLVQEIFDTGKEEPVYNLRVAEHHTYFVGGVDWGFSVWAHNACAIVYWYPPRTFDVTVNEPHLSVETVSDAGRRIHTEMTFAPGAKPGAANSSGTMVAEVPAADAKKATFTVTIPLPNGEAAQAFQVSVINKPSPEKWSMTRNCFSHVADVLIHGGVPIGNQKGFLGLLKDAFGFNPLKGPK